MVTLGILQMKHYPALYHEESTFVGTSYIFFCCHNFNSNFDLNKRFRSTDKTRCKVR